MSTFGELKQRVSLRLTDTSNTAVSAATVGQFINDALAFWKNRPLWFNQTSSVVTMTAGDPAITGLPSNFLYELSSAGFVIEDGQERVTQLRVTHQEYDAINLQSEDRPSFYTYRDSGFLFYPYPDQAYTLRVYFISDYAEMVSDSDTNDWTEQASGVLMHEALSRIHGEIRQDEKQSAYHAQRAQQEFNVLLGRSGKHVSNHRNTIHE